MDTRRHKWRNNRRQTTARLALLLITTVAMAALGESAGEKHDRAIKLARAGSHQEALTLLDELAKESPVRPKLLADKAVVLSWAGRDAEAISLYESLPATTQRKHFVMLPIAKSRRIMKQFARAEAMYHDVIKKSSKYPDAFRGLALALLGRDRVDESIAALEEGLGHHPNSPSLLFRSALLHWHHKRDYVLALQRLNHLLDIEPAHRAAINEKAKLVSDMGAGKKSLEFAKLNATQIDLHTAEYLHNNMSAQFIRWQEPDEAVRRLAWARRYKQIDEGPQKLRATYDEVLARTDLRDTTNVIVMYESLMAQDSDQPSWIHDAAGGAYLREKEAKKSVAAYRRSISLNPRGFDSRMGLFHALVECGDYKEARDVRDQLERDTPKWVYERGLNRYNWNKQDVVLARGWLLAFQNRNAEAEEFFLTHRSKAPGNLAIRTGLGHVQLWRGLPETAEEELRIVQTMAGDYDEIRRPHVDQVELAARIGRLRALNSAGHKSDARDTINELREKSPRNRHVHALDRALRIEDSTEFFFDIVFDEESPGVDETYMLTRLSQPLTPELAAYVFYLHRDTEGLGLTSPHRRYGAGAWWRPRHDLLFTGEHSRENEGETDEGWLAKLAWQANDYWSAAVGYNSFSLNVPLRARVTDVDGTQADLSLAYRTSDRFMARAYNSLVELDDSNDSHSYGLNIERALITRAHWQNRLFLEASRTENALTNVPYYSPEHLTTYYASHMLQHTVYRVRDWAFVHRLHLGAGWFDQADYDPDFIWNMRYEHDYLLSDWTALLWGVNFQRRYYDSEETDLLSWYLTYRQKF